MMVGKERKTNKKCWGIKNVSRSGGVFTEGVRQKDGLMGFPIKIK